MNFYKTLDHNLEFFILFFRLRSQCWSMLSVMCNTSVSFYFSDKQIIVFNMSATPNNSTGPSSSAAYEGIEVSESKFWRKIKKDPVVPIGKRIFIEKLVHFSRFFIQVWLDSVWSFLEPLLVLIDEIVTNQHRLIGKKANQLFDDEIRTIDQIWF